MRGVHQQENNWHPIFVANSGAWMAPPGPLFRRGAQRERHRTRILAPRLVGGAENRQTRLDCGTPNTHRIQGAAALHAKRRLYRIHAAEDLSGRSHAPPWRHPRGKSMVSLVTSHTNATRIGWHLWEIDLIIFAPGLPLGRTDCHFSYSPPARENYRLRPKLRTLRGTSGAGPRPLSSSRASF